MGQGKNAIFGRLTCRPFKSSAPAPLRLRAVVAHKLASSLRPQWRRRLWAFRARQGRFASPFRFAVPAHLNVYGAQPSRNSQCGV
jgi:hypothetical protein